MTRRLAVFIMKGKNLKDVIRLLQAQLQAVVDILENAPDIVEGLKELFLRQGRDTVVEVETVREKGTCRFLKIRFPGKRGKTEGKDAPTLGIVGQLGGIRADAHRMGLVSDGDGAVAALAAALKLADMVRAGQIPSGDVIVTTHICTDAPILERKPVPFMGLPVEMSTMNRHLVDPEMDALISLDTTKGNRLLNRRGIAITPTVKGGYILKVSDGLLTLLEQVTGLLPAVLPITTQDITTYHNGLHHINSIMQPATMTRAPVIGLAITAQSVVPGCATGASCAEDIEAAARFCVETAKLFGEEPGLFHDEAEYQKLVSRYGDLGFLCRIDA